MKVLVYHKPKDVRVESVDDRAIQQPTDAIIRVTSNAISGADLDVYNGIILQPHDMVEEAGTSVMFSTRRKTDASRQYCNHKTGRS